jgi:glutamate-1-semialdehyde 2,1-aminomutase
MSLLLRSTRSAALSERAARVIPGGVNTARRRIDPPLCVADANGGWITDVDGNKYLDFHAAYGAVLLGHRHHAVEHRVKAQMARVTLPGVGVTEVETELAERIVHHVESADKVVLCGSGSEATFHAIRLARAATGRTKIVKFQGMYHGFHDYVLLNVMSAPAQVGKRDPTSAGMLPAAVDATLVCRINDLADVHDTFARHDGEIAAVIVEPIGHNAPSILPGPGFLAGLREACNRAGALLIFDEVITGFRHHLGGYQAIAGVRPDLSTFGKALANGYPLAVVAGDARLLDLFNTTASGTVTFAGTFNGHPLSSAAALGTLDTLESEPVHEHLFRLGELMRTGLREIAASFDLPVVVSGYGSLYTMLFMSGPLVSYDDVLRNDKDLFVRYRRGLVGRGVLEMPENIGRNHIMYAHTEADINRALDVAHEALSAIIAGR